MVGKRYVGCFLGLLKVILQVVFSISYRSNKVGLYDYMKSCMTFLSFSLFSAQTSNDTWLLLKALFSVK